MKQEDFEEIIRRNSDTLSKIKTSAHQIHESVNQHYGNTLPYSVHIDRVAKITAEYAWLICDTPEDVIPIIFGAYFHDTIEDARLTYNDVKGIALTFMSEQQAIMAAEIVYALTNEKGRTRTERANEKYYKGIRTTPYAPLCKVADRLANVSFSAEKRLDSDKRMYRIYASENPHFMAALSSEKSDISDLRLTIPGKMKEKLQQLLNEN